MHVHVTVELDENDELVVVKAAAGPGAARLRAEAERLRRAAHPGVVSLIDAGPVDGATTDGGATAATHRVATDRAPGHDPAAAEPVSGEAAATGGVAPAPVYSLRLAHAGEALTRWSGSPPVVAGVAAAVASTLADLHDIGIVHGRLDASHVLIGPDGRPRLCSLSDPGEATSAGDVAAWGRLVADLVERAPRERRRGLARLGRADPRRALLAVVDGAVDPVPERRPSARALADAVLTAVPGATLPVGAGGGHDHTALGAAMSGSTRGHDDGRRAAGGHRREGDTLDRIWSYAGEPTEAERWAAAFGSGPPDRSPTPAADDLPLAEIAALAWPGADAGPDPDDGGRDDTGGGLAVLAAGGDPWAVDADGLDDVARGATEGAVRPARRAHDLAAGGPPTLPLTTLDAAPGPPGWHDPGDRDRDGDRDGVGDDGRTRDHAPAQRRRAAIAAAAADVPPSSARRRRRRVAVAAVVVALAATTVAALTLDLGPGGGADAPRAEAPPAPPGCPPVAAPAADVDGDGCRDGLAVDGATVDAGVARWTLGEPGDVVAVGDWDCDGDASAALLRPTSGDVFVFPTWAAVDEPLTVSPVRRVAGGVGIRALAERDTGCDGLVVDVSGGDPVTVEVAG